MPPSLSNKEALKLLHDKAKEIYKKTSLSIYKKMGESKFYDNDPREISLRDTHAYIDSAHKRIEDLFKKLEQ